MRVRAITLKDVRRFIDPVRIDGIADGVNVLSAPNEFGKSTVFDALRALFFVPHGSRGKEIGQLRPHAGGAPEVSVEIETAEGRFVLSKRWFAKPAARVMGGDVLVAQADEAEAWIARLLGGGDGGPSGLLWVRQGLTSLAEGSAGEQKAALAARRDLLSSVTGEVEAMTGGRRMDAALARCRDELKEYATGTGKPRVGGAWAEAMQEVDALTAARDGFAARVASLREALAERLHKRRALAEIDTPEARAEREARLAAAAEAHTAAQAHAARVAAAEAEVKAATSAADRAREDLTAMRRTVADHVEALRRDAEAVTQTEGAAATLAVAERALATAGMEHDRADAARQSAEDALRLVQGRAAALAAQDRRADLQDRLARATAARQAVEAARAAASVGPAEAAMDRLRRLAEARTTARALRDSTATRLSMRYAAGQAGGARIGDTPLEPDTVLPIHEQTVILLAGLGDLTVYPGAGPEGLADVAGAEAALVKALAALGMASMDAAGQAHRQRKEAADRLTAATAELAAHAPKGIEDLQSQLAALPDVADAVADLPTPQEAEAAWHAARAAAAEVSARREVLRERRDAARTAQVEAAVRREAATERLQAARAALDRLAVRDEAELAARGQEAAAVQAEAEALVAGLRAAAPDLAATRATLARATSVAEAARKQVEDLRPAIAALDERIAGNSGEAVEERLQETEERLEAAVARLARIAREVRVLQCLQAALEAARAEARDRYFAPVAGELRPLLHLLWPEAELDWADDTLLPQALIRNGTAEAIDILSGGTQEQIAFLVRLAFARLLARDGRHAPVILDDALVFTDDDRIERMFDALHRQAGDLQIIVLSCRQRAFRDLGGTVLTIAAGG